MFEDRISEGVSIQLPSGGQSSRAVDISSVAVADLLGYVVKRVASQRKFDGLDSPVGGCCSPHGTSCVHSPSGFKGYVRAKVWGDQLGTVALLVACDRAEIGEIALAGPLVTAGSGVGLG